MTTIGAQDEARVFPLLREYFVNTTPYEADEVERHYSHDRLRMIRDTDPTTFQAWVDSANEWKEPRLPFAA